ncbi:hypothetical protein [Gallibacterium genomosp. 2]|nr:hypothetical protein [Gallibacterium genomosp. 2]
MEGIEHFQWKIRNRQITLHEEALDKYHSFLKYLAIGWIRPDLLPIQLQLLGDNPLRREWFDFFQSISYGKSEIGNYKVSAGVYKSYPHFEKYIYNGIQVKYRSVIASIAKGV